MPQAGGRPFPLILNSLAEAERVRAYQAELSLETVAGAVTSERAREAAGGRKGGTASGKRRISKRGDTIENHRERWDRLRKTLSARSAAMRIQRETGFHFDAIARHFRTHPTA